MYHINKQCCFSLISLAALCFSPAGITMDKQLKLTLKAPLVPDKVHFKGEVDIRKDAGRLYKKHIDMGVRLPTHIGGLVLGLHYRKIYTYKPGEWELENRPYIQLEKKFRNDHDMVWTLRTRHELRHRNNKSTQRNRLRVKVRLPYTVFNAKPYISNEYYYDVTEHQLSQARIDIGLTFPQFKRMTPTLSYKVTAKQKDKWETSSAFVLGIAF